MRRGIHTFGRPRGVEAVGKYAATHPVTRTVPTGILAMCELGDAWVRDGFEVEVEMVTSNGLGGWSRSR